VPRLKRGKGVANRGRTACSRRIFFWWFVPRLMPRLMPRLKRGKQKPQKTRGLRYVPRLPRLISLSKRLFFFRRADYLRSPIGTSIVAIVASLRDESCQFKGGRLKKKSRRLIWNVARFSGSASKAEFINGIGKE